jgi:hypothetical protein
VPWIALVGLGHLGVAWGLASHRRLAQTAARVVAGSTAVAAGIAVVATAAGVATPLAAGNDPKAVVATALLAAAYASATLLADREPTG